MSNEVSNRREFLKRAGVAGAVLASSVVAVAATTENVHRGHTDNTGNGVVVGSSNKKEILYKKTQNWDMFYNSAH